MTPFEQYTVNEFVSVRKLGVCWVCDTPTPYVSISFETYVCSGLCDWAATQAYFMALRENDPWKDRHESAVLVR